MTDDSAKTYQTRPSASEIDKRMQDLFPQLSEDARKLLCVGVLADDLKIILPGEGDGLGASMVETKRLWP